MPIGVNLVSVVEVAIVAAKRRVVEAGPLGDLVESLKLRRTLLMKIPLCTFSNK